LIAAGTDDAILAILQNEIEERWESDWLFETAKAWDAIHRCLTDGTLEHSSGTYPFRLAIMGGQQLHKGGAYVVSLVRPGEVADVAEALSKIDRGWLRNKYDTLDVELYGVEKSDEDWKYRWE
jgi:Domain of unknown function (DUF1877)